MREPRIVIFGINYSPEPTGIATNTTWLAESLAQFATWQYYLDRYGEMPEEALAQHAAFEDWLASTYLPDLDPAWKGRQRPRAMHPGQIAKLHSMAR